MTTERTLPEETSEMHPPVLESPYGPDAWKQPRREQVLIDGNHALLAKPAFESLLEYSATLPTGAYPGKMWRHRDRSGKWYLGWYGLSASPDMVSINYREVILV